MRGAFLFLLVVALACRGATRTELTPAQLTALVDSLRPPVEAAVGLPFRGPVTSAITSRDAVQAYLLDRIGRDFPPERLEGITAAYRLFGLLPDTLDLTRLLLDLYREQVAGYYDPDTETLFAVEGADPQQLRLILAHELIHALQHQYLPLDSLMVMRDNGDEVAAVQAVLEGHATVGSIRVLAPGTDVVGSDALWDGYQDEVRAQQARMPVFGAAPMVLREGLIFPYLAGAGFVRWWESDRATPLPTVPELPRSTEQVLHPARYLAPDPPVRLEFGPAPPDLMYEDTLGELEVQILLAQLAGAERPGYDAALGWGGDRYRVMRTPDGPALVWFAVWDTPGHAERVAARLRDGRDRLARQGYRFALDEVTIEGLPGFRVTLAPEGWTGWAGPWQVRRHHP